GGRTAAAPAAADPYRCRAGGPLCARGPARGRARACDDRARGDARGPDRCAPRTRRARGARPRPPVGRGRLDGHRGGSGRSGGGRQLMRALELQRAAVVVAVVCALAGVFLVLRRMALMSDAISHTVLLGIVLVFFLTRDIASPLLVIGAAAMGVATV